MGRAKLIIAKPIEGDVAVARIDTATMQYLGTKEGSEVDIFGGVFTPIHIRVKVVKAAPDDEDKGIIRISNDKLTEGDLKIGMKITADASWTV